MLILGWKCFHFGFLRNLLKLRCLTRVDFIVAIFSHLDTANNLILSSEWETVLLPLPLFLRWFYCRFSRGISVALWTFFRPEWAKGSSAKGWIKQHFKNNTYIMKSITISKQKTSPYKPKWLTQNKLSETGAKPVILGVKCLYHSFKSENKLSGTPLKIKVLSLFNTQPLLNSMVDDRFVFSWLRWCKLVFHPCLYSCTHILLLKYSEEADE